MKFIHVAAGLVLVLALAGFGSAWRTESKLAKPVAQAATTETQTIKEGAYPMKQSPTNPQLRKLSGKKIAITIHDKQFVVDLYENSAASDLWNRLPLTYTSSDYRGWDEKLIRLGSDKGLDMTDYTGGDEPGYPELGYYQPDNWISMYYGHIGYWPGKIPLGKIQATNEEIKAVKDGSAVRIERVDG